ncbi:dienelactone hydrolase family protein [Lysobacter soyae]|uniref:Dienelactone hydrolase family protein n=1 Tax=Lysobacter soyae TaxID=2764185 RepID=A0ABX8WNQ2_9GAMM|nr:dienelactone hydrolase family protein [Lysobacter sp. CJ11]QYR52054.1 dienelactone hydrolase family protein [Lysobacter sp. CJ11]
METVSLHVANCPDVKAYLAEPETPASAGIVVIQEIFGANAHIRDVTRHFAQEGYLAIAPAFFDIESPDVELDYDADGMNRGRALAAAVGFDRALDVVRSACDVLKARGAGVVGVVGFCWGGSVAFLCNTRLGLPAVSYYGAKSLPFLNETARAPLMFHFGAEDASIPPEAIEKTRAAQPAAELFVYKGAGHAFNRDVDNSHYHAEAAYLADERSLRFFKESLR